MGFLSSIANIFSGDSSDYGALMAAYMATLNAPKTDTKEDYLQPTFDPGVYSQVLGALPKADIEGLYGYGMTFDPATGKMSQTRGGSQTAGGAYSDKMKQYIESMGKDLYNDQVLPGLQARGVLSRPGYGQTSREETLGTRDWGRMLTQQGLQAEAKGIDLEQAGQKDLLSQLQSALGVDIGVVPTARGTKSWDAQTFYA
jgi:hypothetical protein